jgi:mono/diheme cytochrome c family protein
VPISAKPASRNRGAYLVEGAAHCAECHSARNAIGVIPAERRYAGGPNPEGKGSVPNITTDKTGIGDWSKGDIADVLSSGLTPSGDSVGSNMVEVVRNTSQLAPADRDAIAEYIKSLPPRVGWKAPK